MNKRLSIAVLLLFSSLSVLSQDQSATGAVILQTTKLELDSSKGWIFGGNLALNFSQVQLSNWVGGGQNSMTVTSFVSVIANYKKGKTTWDNKLDLAYGMMQQGKDGFFKNDDRIDLMTKYGQVAFDSWYYSALLNFRSQFDVGFKSPTDHTVLSRFLAPAYIIGAIGLDYKGKANFTFFVSPLTNKTTIVRDADLSAAGAFGLDPGKKARYEIGGFIRTGFAKDVFTNVNVASSVDLFSNYLHNPRNIDVNWNTLITMKINKFLATSVSAQFLYDDDIEISLDDNKDGVIEGKGKRIQFKEVLSLGISYKF